MYLEHVSRFHMMWFMLVEPLAKKDSVLWTSGTYDHVIS